MRHLIGVICSGYAWRDDKTEAGLLGKYLGECWGMRIGAGDVEALAGVGAGAGMGQGGSMRGTGGAAFGGLGETGRSSAGSDGGLGGRSAAPSDLATRRGAAGGRRRRVLVHHHDATEEEVTIFDDVGLLPADEPALRAKLRLGGVKSVHSAVLLD